MPDQEPLSGWEIICSDIYFAARGHLLDNFKDFVAIWAKQVAI